MIIPIIGASATEFWLNHNITENFRTRLCTLPPDFNFEVTASEAIHIVQRIGLSFPLRMVTYNHANERKRKFCQVDFRRNPYSENSFMYFRMQEYEIYVACPELCFLEAARQIDLPYLVLFGMQFCAQYYNDSKQLSRFQRIPVTTSDLIINYLKNQNGIRGIELARAAAKYVINNSNSPMESEIATMMITPIRHGGYGMPRFTMNETLDLTDEEAAIARQRSICSDFFWRTQRVASEYNSKEYHLNAAQQVRDACRQNALKLRGIYTYPITIGNIDCFDDIERTMNGLYKVLGKKKNVAALKKHQAERKRLCSEILKTSPYLDNLF